MFIILDWLSMTYLRKTNHSTPGSVILSEVNQVYF